MRRGEYGLNRLVLVEGKGILMREIALIRGVEEWRSRGVEEWKSEADICHR